MENKEKEPLLSAHRIKLLTDPFGQNNPITVQVLGICSALAVTVKMKPALVMAVSVTIVVALSNVIIAAMRKAIPGRISIIVQLVVIATLVILVDQVLIVPAKLLEWPPISLLTQPPQARRQTI